MGTTVKMLVNRHKIKADSVWADRNPNMDDMPNGSSHYKVTLKGFGRRYTLYFSMGPAHTKEPEAADVLDCLLSDSDVENAQGFEDWAGNLGFDPDSRKAEKIYNACLKSAEKLRRFLGDKFQEFYEAERG